MIVLNTLILAACSIGLGFLGLMNGWGLQPQSWPWILGTLAGQGIIHIILASISVKADDDIEKARLVKALKDKMRELDRRGSGD